MGATPSVPKDIVETKRRGGMLAYVVQGVCFAEKYFLPTDDAARTVIRQQQNGEGMGDVERSVDPITFEQFKAAFRVPNSIDF